MGTVPYADLGGAAGQQAHNVGSGLRVISSNTIRAPDQSGAIFPPASCLIEQRMKVYRSGRLNLVVRSLAATRMIYAFSAPVFAVFEDLRQETYFHEGSAEKVNSCVTYSCHQVFYRFLCRSMRTANVLRLQFYLFFSSSKFLFLPLDMTPFFLAAPCHDLVTVFVSF